MRYSYFLYLQWRLGDFGSPVEAGADTFVTGEVRHHQALFPELGLNVELQDITKRSNGVIPLIAVYSRKRLSTISLALSDKSRWRALAGNTKWENLTHLYAYQKQN